MPDGSSNRSKPKVKRTAVDRLAAKHAKERHMLILKRAYLAVHKGTIESALVRLGAEASYDEAKAVVYAVTPGRQQARNIAELLDKGIKAAARTIRRRGRPR